MAMLPDYGPPVFPFGKFRNIPIDKIMKEEPTFWINFVFPFGEYYILNEPVMKKYWRDIYGEPPVNA